MRPTVPRGLFVGLATLDVISHVDRAPGPDEKVTATWQLLAGGGPALNAAVVFAAAGGDATLVTRVGNGPAADLVRADLAECGVSLVDLAGPGSNPPVSGITVESDGSRRVVGLDAVSRLGDRPLDHAVADLALEADVVLVDAHHPDLAARALTASAGAFRLMDAGRWKPAMAELIPACSHVLASAAFRLDGIDESTPQRLGRLLDRIEGPAVVGVTSGGESLLWRSRGADGEVSSGRLHPPSVAVVDTLGAGDALHGAYAWALASAVDDPLGFAVDLASRSCEHRGTRSWLAELRGRRDVDRHRRGSG